MIASVLQTQRDAPAGMLPPPALLLPRLHAITIVDPPAWRGFPLGLSLAHLESLDLQVHDDACGNEI